MQTLVQRPRTAPRRAPIAGAGAGALVLGRYRLDERLGAGGFGVVWRAHDELLRRDVAVKRIPLSPDGDSERAGREALAAARLAHPAIVALYEAAAVEDAFYLISELVHGETLAKLIAAGELADEHVLEIGVALAEALSHAHARGVIHRDVKPPNVLVPHARCKEGELVPGSSRAAAKLTDFGGARLAGTDVLTRTGDVLGTLAYMAPEQSEGEEAAEPADLYSLALVLYECLCGVNPVRAPTPAATVRRIGRPIAPLGGRRDDLPATLTEALDRALSAAPAERGTLDQLRSGIEHALVLALDVEGRGERDLSPRALAHLRRARPGPASRGIDSELPAWDPAPPRLRGPAAPEDTLQARHPRARTRLPRGPARDPAASASDNPPRAPDLSRSAGAHPGERLPLLPRGAWLTAAAAFAAWQGASGRPGAGLVCLTALLAPALLAGRRRGSATAGTSWALLAAGLAPALGTVGLAGAYPALAAQARRWRTRAALGALGYWWLALCEPLLGRRLWLGAPPGASPRATWEGSVQGAAVHVLGPLLTPGLLFGVLVWAAGATCLPWIVRGRRAALDVVATATWSAAMAGCAPLLRTGAGGAIAHATPRGAVLGAVLGGLFAVCARALRGPV